MPCSIQNPKVNIPVQLIQQLFMDKLLPAFKVFIAIKMATPGHFVPDKCSINKLCSLSGCKKRTLLKHLIQLVEKGWVGHNKINNTYHARSWVWFRQNNFFFCRATYPISVGNMPNFQQHLFAAFITWKIDMQKQYAIFAIGNRQKGALAKLKRAAVSKGGTAPQVLSADALSNKEQFPYFGLSNRGIGKHLNLSESRARQIKQKAVGLGLLRTQDHYELIIESHSPKGVLSAYKIAFPDEKGIRLKKNSRKRYDSCQVLRQLHTEIIPQIKLFRINYLHKIKQKKMKMNFNRFITVGQKK